MFYLGGVVLSFFLTLLLLSKSNKTIADKILAGWLLLISVQLLLFYFQKMLYYPQLLGVGIPLPLVHGPFLYLYARALTDRALSLNVSLLQFIPFLASFMYIIPFLALSQEQKIVVFKNNGVGYEAFNLVQGIANITSGVLYVILSGIVLRKHRMSIANEFSFTEKINLDWLRYLIYWIGVIWVLVIFGDDNLIFGAVVLFILFIGFFGIRQVGIFHSHGLYPKNNRTEETLTIEPIEHSIVEGPNPNHGEQESSGQEMRKYQKSGLSDESSEALHLQLMQMMRDRKLYCESELSLFELARHLGTQPNYLSQVINEREGKNFYDYINTLRIEEFTRVAASLDSRKYTLLALAQQCGFNSKSSFNRYFKKVTGQSPSEFLLAISDAGE